MVYREICEGAVGEGGVYGGMGNLSCLCVGNPFFPFFCPVMVELALIIVLCNQMFSMWD